jgi:hypothetical protein
MALENEAAHNRDIAVRARRMAGSLTLEADRKRIERYADDLEHHAADLEDRLGHCAPSLPVLPYSLGSNSKTNSNRPPNTTNRRGMRDGTESQ